MIGIAEYLPKMPLILLVRKRRHCNRHCLAYRRCPLLSKWISANPVNDIPYFVQVHPGLWGMKLIFLSIGILHYYRSIAVVLIHEEVADISSGIVDITGPNH